MTRPFDVTEAELRRFDKPGPRYTSYPTAVEFHPGVGETAYGEHLAAANGAGADAPLSLYAHLPFCEHRCLFCGCHVVIARRDDVPERYLEYLKREVALVAEHMPDRRHVAQLQWGGGTPTRYRPDQLADLFGTFTEHFTFTPNAEIAIEVDPRVTDRAHLEALASVGFNRLSFGVQDLTPEVQEAITRNQTLEQTRSLMECARSVGFSEGVNIDLIYGLPRQQLDSFTENLRAVIELRPDRVAVYSFAYVPWIRGHQKDIREDELPARDVKLELFAVEHDVPGQLDLAVAVPDVEQDSELVVLEDLSLQDAPVSEADDLGDGRRREADQGCQQEYPGECLGLAHGLDLHHYLGRSSRRATARNRCSRGVPRRFHVRVSSMRTLRPSSSSLLKVITYA